MKLQITPARLIAAPTPDGKGYELYREGEHNARLTIGNVTVAFDGRNNWSGGPACSEVIELSEYTDCPVQLGCADSPRVGRSSTEKLLYALAADLGYSVSSAEMLLYALAADLGYSVSRND